MAVGDLHDLAQVHDHDAIGHLPRVAAGERSPGDAMHFSAGHRASTLEVIRAVPKDGGNRPPNVGPACLRRAHERQGKAVYEDVYGRLRWDRPAITITAYARNPASGRFVHPEQDRGLTAREAALKAMHKVTGPVVAIVLVLTAVFVPIAFLGGLTGELYRQFAVTISAAMVISAMNALTLSQALCAVFLKPRTKAKNWFFRWFDRSFQKTGDGYAGAVGWLAHTVERVGFAASLSAVSLKAVLVIALGLVLALDGSATGFYRWVRMPCPRRDMCRQRMAGGKQEEESC